VLKLRDIVFKKVCRRFRAISVQFLCDVSADLFVLSEYRAANMGNFKSIVLT
jgi:hypothetical protein